MSIDILNSRLDALDTLTIKVDTLDTKLHEETGVIRTALTVTNRDVQRLSTELEVLEEQHLESDIFGSRVQSKKDASEMNREEITRDRLNNRNASASNEKDTIGQMVIERIERVLPRLLAAELNHFYLNMASKVDHSMGQLQRETMMRLRRLEGTTKNTLMEIQNGRQDISHLTHLQRSANLNISSLISERRVSQSCECLEGVFSSADAKDFLHHFSQNISTAVIQSFSKFHQNSTNSEELKEQKHSGGISSLSSSLSSDLWRGVFTGGLGSSHSPMKISSSSSMSPKHCADSSAFDTLQEVKELLITLITKGEDLRRSLTKQTNEGVDLLKLLHQRFSVLMRRMNTDPDHGEALLSEVQELEHLVENSYSSILMAQNVFIETCHRIQQQQPTLEGKIIEILNQLVTNIDLGHRFSRHQLQELRKLIEQMAENEEPKDFSFLSSWITSKVPENPLEPFPERGLEASLPRDRFFSTLVLTVAEANSTEEKLREVINRIRDVEEELQSMGGKSAELKNTVDELLTGAKDLKGYSRDQIETLQNLQEGILELAETYTEFMYTLSAAFHNDTSSFAIDFEIVKNISKLRHKEKHQFYIPEECSLSLLRQLRSAEEDNTGKVDSGVLQTLSPDSPEKVRLKKEAPEKGAGKVFPQQNAEQKPSNPKSTISTDMLMDQDLGNITTAKEYLGIYHLIERHDRRKEGNQITIPENDFEQN